jgi:hypothetical protein
LQPVAPSENRTHSRMLSETSILAFENSPTYSSVCLYTLKDISTTIETRLGTHLLSGAGGTPGACRAAISSVCTSVIVKASPSANSTSSQTCARHERRKHEMNSVRDAATHLRTAAWSRLPLAARHDQQSYRLAVEELDTDHCSS